MFRSGYLLCDTNRTEVDLSYTSTQRLASAGEKFTFFEPIKPTQFIGLANELALHRLRTRYTKQC